MAEGKSFNVQISFITDIKNLTSQLNNLMQQFQQSSGIVNQFGAAIQNAFSGGQKSANQLAKNFTEISKPISKNADLLGYYSEHSKNLVKTNNELANSVLKGANNFQDLGYQINPVSDAFKQLGNDESDVSQKTKEVGEINQKNADTTQKMGEQTKNTTGFIGRLRKQLGSYIERLSKTTGETKQFTGELKSSGASVQGVARGLRDMGDALSLFVFAAGQATTMTTQLVNYLVDFSKQATQSGAELDLQIRRIQVVSGETYEDIKNNIFDLVESTGAAADEVAEAFRKMIFAGIEYQTAVEAMNQGLLVGIAANEDFVTVVKLAVAALNVFNKTSSQLPEVFNSIYVAAAASPAAISQLSDSLNYVGPVAASVGISLEQMISVLTILSQRGVEGSKAGTALRRVLTELSRSTEDMLDALHALNIYAYDGTQTINGEVIAAHDLEDQMKNSRIAVARLTEEQLNLKVAQNEANILLTQYNAIVNNIQKNIDELNNRIDSHKKMIDAINNSYKNVNKSIDDLSSSIEYYNNLLTDTQRREEKLANELDRKLAQAPKHVREEYERLIGVQEKLQAGREGGMFTSTADLLNLNNQLKAVQEQRNSYENIISSLENQRLHQEMILQTIQKQNANIVETHQNIIDSIQNEIDLRNIEIKSIKEQSSLVQSIYDETESSLNIINAQIEYQNSLYEQSYETLTKNTFEMKNGIEIIMDWSEAAQNALKDGSKTANQFMAELTAIFGLRGIEAVSALFDMASMLGTNTEEVKTLRQSIDELYQEMISGGMQTNEQLIISTALQADLNRITSETLKTQLEVGKSGLYYIEKENEGLRTMTNFVSNLGPITKEIFGMIERFSPQLLLLGDAARTLTFILIMFQRSVGLKQITTNIKAMAVEFLALGKASLFSASGIKAATLASLKFIATPLGIVLATISGAILLIVAYMNNWYGIQEKLNPLVENFQWICGKIVDFFKMMGATIQNVIIQLTKLLEPLGKVQSAFEKLLEFTQVGMIKNAVGELHDIITSARLEDESSKVDSISESWEKYNQIIAEQIPIFKDSKIAIDDMGNAYIKFSDSVETGLLASYGPDLNKVKTELEPLLDIYETEFAEFQKKLNDAIAKGDTELIQQILDDWKVFNSQYATTIKPITDTIFGKGNIDWQNELAEIGGKVSAITENILADAENASAKLKLVSDKTFSNIILDFKETGENVSEVINYMANSSDENIKNLYGELEELANEIYKNNTKTFTDLKMDSQDVLAELITYVTMGSSKISELLIIPFEKSSVYLKEYSKNLIGVGDKFVELLNMEDAELAGLVQDELSAAETTDEFRKAMESLFENGTITTEMIKNLKEHIKEMPEDMQPTYEIILDIAEALGLANDRAKEFEKTLDETGKTISKEIKVEDSYTTISERRLELNTKEMALYKRLEPIMKTEIDGITKLSLAYNNGMINADEYNKSVAESENKISAYTKAQILATYGTLKSEEAQEAYTKAMEIFTETAKETNSVLDLQSELVENLNTQYADLSQQVSDGLGVIDEMITNGQDMDMVMANLIADISDEAWPEFIEILKNYPQLITEYGDAMLYAQTEMTPFTDSLKDMTNAIFENEASLELLVAGYEAGAPWAEKYMDYVFPTKKGQELTNIMGKLGGTFSELTKNNPRISNMFKIMEDKSKETAVNFDEQLEKLTELTKISPTTAMTVAQRMMEGANAEEQQKIMKTLTEGISETANMLPEIKNLVGDLAESGEALTSQVTILLKYLKDIGKITGEDADYIEQLYSKIDRENKDLKNEQEKSTNETTASEISSFIKLGDAVGELKNDFSSLNDYIISEFIGILPEELQEPFISVIGSIQGAFKNFIDMISPYAQEILKELLNESIPIINTVFEKIRGEMSSLLDTGRETFTEIAYGFLSSMSPVIKSIGSQLNNILNNSYNLDIGTKIRSGLEQIKGSGGTTVNIGDVSFPDLDSFRNWLETALRGFETRMERTATTVVRGG